MRELLEGDALPACPRLLFMGPGPLVLAWAAVLMRVAQLLLPVLLHGAREGHGQGAACIMRSGAAVQAALLAAACWGACCCWGARLRLLPSMMVAAAVQVYGKRCTCRKSAQAGEW